MHSESLNQYIHVDLQTLKAENIFFQALIVICVVSLSTVYLFGSDCVVPFVFHLITEFKMVFLTDYIQLTVSLVFFGVTTCYRGKASSVQGNLKN